MGWSPTVNIIRKEGGLRPKTLSRHKGALCGSGVRLSVGLIAEMPADPAFGEDAIRSEHKVRELQRAIQFGLPHGSPFCWPSDASSSRQVVSNCATRSLFSGRGEELRLP